jgi:hypothetical protein
MCRCRQTPFRPRSTDEHGAVVEGGRAARRAGARGGLRMHAQGPRPPARPILPRSCRSPTATSTSSTASSSTSRARSTTSGCAPCWTRCSTTRRCARVGGVRRAGATATTPTLPACSSVRSPSARLRSTSASCTRAWTRTCSSARRSFTTSARRASSRTAPRSASPTPGACSATSSSDSRCCATARPRSRRSTAGASSRSRTACSATTAPTPRQAAASALPRRSR